MPTYQNRTGVVTTIGEYQFAPFEIRHIKRNIYWEPPLFLTDTNPQYNPYTIRLKIAKKAGDTSKPFVHNHSLILRVDDSFPIDWYDSSKTPANTNPEGSLLDIGVYATVGEHHCIASYQLMRVISFKKYRSWYAIDPGSERIPQMLLDIEYEMIYLAVLKFQGTSVDISTKPY